MKKILLPGCASYLKENRKFAHTDVMVKSTELKSHLGVISGNVTFYSFSITLSFSLCDVLYVNLRLFVHVLGCYFVWQEESSNCLLGRFLMTWRTYSGKNCCKVGIGIWCFICLSKNNGKWQVNFCSLRWAQWARSENSASAWVILNCIQIAFCMPSHAFQCTCLFGTS